ncbi:proteasome subunit beta type-7 [Endogone sp. FLAS-F59071]|nr:proteasome subunit beta type-7 [Endogone sp. FLAS-F59071]|eukprot:RUS20959.1 proteasome subunit beta type-7 [Endogone sp. FLAS-F59071]
MALKYQLPKGGFNFDNVQRYTPYARLFVRAYETNSALNVAADPVNKALENKGARLPNATSTGTTIAGVIFKDGIILGADTRATGGSIVADKNCNKLHYLSPNIHLFILVTRLFLSCRSYCGGAGTAADTDFTTALISSQLELHSLATGRQPRVVTAMLMLKQMLFRYHGHVSASLILGGYDLNGPQLHTVYPHGSTDDLPYVSMGSGSLAAMSIFESRWRKDMERQEAIDLVQTAIEAGIFNDLGSGSSVDIAIIEQTGVEKIRGYAKPNERGKKEKSYKFERGTTAVLKTSIHNFVKVVEGDEMDTS